jgi:hypothetical protein
MGLRRACDLLVSEASEIRGKSPIRPFVGINSHFECRFNHKCVLAKT